jgi:hypothetical protein
MNVSKKLECLSLASLSNLVNMTPEACIIKFITAVIYSLRNKLECLSVASLFSLVKCLGTN